MTSTLGISEMTGLLTFLLGLLGGFAAHTVTMKVSFKQRTIDNKIKVFDSIIGTWVKMRNYIFAHHPGHPVSDVPAQVAFEFDQMYGQSQQLIGEAILICEDEALTTELNRLNEQLYRTPWAQMEYEAVNAAIEQFKTEALLAVARMRNDIKRSTRLELSDFSHILSGLFGRKD
ncbi:MAG: hypothetical protein HYS18_01605 [Burkholderiales bacterium]|nr:hypothetical protein [Burkholderiales bacterium]